MSAGAIGQKKGRKNCGEKKAQELKVLHEPPRLEIFWVWLPIFGQATIGQPFGPIFGKLAPPFGL